MSEFLDGCNEAHAELDDMDPSVLEIHGTTPAGGCLSTSWPLDGDVSTPNGTTFTPVDCRVSVLRSKVTGSDPETGMPATLDGKSFVISAVKRDSIAWELDLSDPRKL